MAQPHMMPSFAAGELSPSMYARVDTAKYQVGAALLRNFFVDYRGGVSNCPGTQYVGQCKDTTQVRLVPFQFNTEQTYILEFGNLYMRPIKDGAYVLEATKNITGITQANPGVVTSVAHGFSNGDWVYLTGIGGMTQLNGRTVKIAAAAADTFQIRDTITDVAINTSAYGAYTSGGTVARLYTLVTPYTTADLAQLKWAQNADTMTLVHPDHEPADLTRTGHAAWTLTTITFGPGLSPPGAPTLTASNTGATMYGYKITAIDIDGNESVASQVGTIIDAKDITETGHILIKWSPVVGADSYAVYKTNPIREASGGIGGIAAPPLGLSYGLMTISQGVTAVDTNINADFAKTPPLIRRPFAPGQIITTTVTAGGSGYTSTPSVAVTGGGGSGAAIEALVVSGAVVSLIITDPGEGYTSAPTITISGGGGSGATATVTIGPQTGTYPSVVSYFQQRRVYAATDNAPESFWLSQPGLYDNFNVSNPTRDDDAISANLSSLQVNAIKHMFPMPGGLIMLTNQAAWQVSGGTTREGTRAITPLTVMAEAQAYNGASDLTPIVINYDVLYVQAQGSAVRDFAYTISANIYTGTDISILSNHLFIDYTIDSWAWAEAPHKLVWAVRSDGILLSLTFLKEQEVIAWAHRDTQGLFKDVATIPEGNESAVYVVVKRIVQNLEVQFVERLSTRQLEGDRENSWFLDAALSTSLTYPAATLQAAAVSGSNVAFVASAAVFGAPDVGKTLRVGKGKATITAFDSTTQIRGNITQEILDVIPNTTTPQLAASGEWSLTANVSSVSNLWHLEGKTVGVFSDGTFLNNQTVTNGSVPVSTPGSLVRVGLRYTSQFQTLRIDLGNPTVQGKRKRVSALTTRFNESFGLKVGPDFDRLEVWNPNVQNFTGETQNGLRTGDYRRNISAGWDEAGQFCAQQDEPYPISILGVIPELNVGDTPA